MFVKPWGGSSEFFPFSVAKAGELALWKLTCQHFHTYCMGHPRRETVGSSSLPFSLFCLNMYPHLRGYIREKCVSNGVFNRMRKSSPPILSHIHPIAIFYFFACSVFPEESNGAAAALGCTVRSIRTFAKWNPRDGISQKRIVHFSVSKKIFCWGNPIPSLYFPNRRGENTQRVFFFSPSSSGSFIPSGSNRRKKVVQVQEKKEKKGEWGEVHYYITFPPPPPIFLPLPSSFVSSVCTCPTSWSRLQKRWNPPNF